MLFVEVGGIQGACKGRILCRTTGYQENGYSMHIPYDWIMSTSNSIYILWCQQALFRCLAVLVARYQPILLMDIWQLMTLANGG